MSAIFKALSLGLFLFHSANAGTNFLTISDIHYGSENREMDGKDIGPKFLKPALDKFNELSKNVDFILCLGDLPTHSLFNYHQKGEFEKTVFNGLYENDTGLKPIFYITGNNDSLLGNYQRFQSNGISPLNYATYWDGACAHCDGLIIDKSHMFHDGYYSSYVIPGNKEIILLALNTIQWTKAPLFYGYPAQDQDALIQLAWLEEQLKKHQSKQLLIAMHIPPGNSFLGKPLWHERYLKKFIELLNKYDNSYGAITLITSHTHMSEFRKIHLNNGHNIYAYSTPSISPIHRNYPGMNVFSLDKQFRVQNITTYYTSNLNSWKNEKYQAIDTPNAIFPGCRNETLVQCLDKLSSAQVCTNLNEGLFYGVKSPTVPNTSCDQIYEVN